MNGILHLLFFWSVAAPSFASQGCGAFADLVLEPADLRGAAVAAALKGVPIEELRSRCGHAGCSDSAEGLAKHLRDAGYDAESVQVYHGLPIRTASGLRRGGLVYHHFVVIKGRTPEEDLIVDGTHLQFLAGPHMGNEPLLFIGTRANLIDYFTRNRARIRVQMLPGASDFDPVSFVENTYGFGDARPFRGPSERAAPLATARPPGSER